jgi:hypothetical protein
VQGVCGGGRRAAGSSAAEKFSDEVAAECEMSEAAARKAAASKISRAIGIEIMHKQAGIHT